MADRMRRAAQAAWTPVARAACEALLGEVLPAWVDRFVPALVLIQERMREMERNVSRHAVSGRRVQWHDMYDAGVILRNVPPRMENVFGRLAENFRQIFATALGTDVGVVQGGAADNTVYYTTNGWLFCVGEIERGADRQVEVFVHVDNNPAPMAEFLRGVEACKPAGMTTGQVVRAAARYRVDAMLYPERQWTAMVPFLSPAASGAFVWFVFNLPAGGGVVRLTESIQLYQAERDGTCVEAVFALRPDPEAGVLEGRCARFPRSARPGAVLALFLILERVCDGESHVFRLLAGLSRWIRTEARHNLFTVRHRLLDNLPELTVALAALLYPSLEAYAAERVSDYVCVARTSQLEFTVTAVDADFHLDVRRP